jgi:hypothetical protein
MFQWITSFIQSHVQKWMFTLCVKLLEPAKPRGLLTHNPKLFVVHPCVHLLRTVLHDRSLAGASVFWAAECSGKSHATAHTAYEIERKDPTRKFIFVDWMQYYAFHNESPIEWFYRQLGLNSSQDQTYLPANLTCPSYYTTIIFDHFDWAMRNDHADAAKQLVLNLATDSSTVGGFNLLVIVTSAVNARALLTIKPHQHFIRLLGSPYAGRWDNDSILNYVDRATNDQSRAWLAQNRETIKRAVDIGVWSGTLREVISILNGSPHNDHYYALRAGQAQSQWTEGHEMLDFYSNAPQPAGDV